MLNGDKLGLNLLFGIVCGATPGKLFKITAGDALRFRRCKNSWEEPRGRLTGRQSISCQPLCVSRVFGSCFKFRQKGAERLPGKQLSTGTDFPPCLRWHKNSLQHCWTAVGAISRRDSSGVYGSDQSLLLFLLYPPPTTTTSHRFISLPAPLSQHARRL